MWLGLFGEVLTFFGRLGRKLPSLRKLARKGKKDSLGRGQGGPRSIGIWKNSLGSEARFLSIESGLFCTGGQERDNNCPTNKALGKKNTHPRGKGLGFVFCELVGEGVDFSKCTVLLIGGGR